MHRNSKINDRIKKGIAGREVSRSSVCNYSIIMAGRSGRLCYIAEGGKDEINTERTGKINASHGRKSG